MAAKRRRDASTSRRQPGAIMTDKDTILVPDRRTQRKINRSLRNLGKCGSSIESFINHRRYIWENNPDLKAIHQNSFNVFLINELSLVVRDERQRQIF
jgi:hypothetical protein